MIVLYGFIVMLLGAGAFITHRRARALERRYMIAAKEADQLAKQMSFRGGNCSVPDPFTVAKRQYELGQLVQIRDRLEEKYSTWAGRAEKCLKLRERVRNCRGRLAPYLLGVVDVLGILTLLTMTGIDLVQVRGVVDTARAIVMK